MAWASAVAPTNCPCSATYFPSSTASQRCTSRPSTRRTRDVTLPGIRIRSSVGILLSGTPSHRAPQRSQYHCPFAIRTLGALSCSHCPSVGMTVRNPKNNLSQTGSVWLHETGPSADTHAHKVERSALASAATWQDTCPRRGDKRRDQGLVVADGNSFEHRDRRTPRHAR
jgi:hypothetical protein